MRDRLFGVLDGMRDYPVTWVSSPAGSGKTTLVASYLRARSVPTLWYRVDEADGDVASFFYYVSEAAKGLKKGQKRPLPLFTPEYRLGILNFTRHYFESLFRKMRLPAAIVFDNYQDVADDSQFHEIIRNGLGIMPEGVRAFVVSRKSTPSTFVSLKAQSMLTNLGWEDIRFSLDEVREMMQQRKTLPVSEDVVHRVHERTQGWAAAVILALDGNTEPSVAVKSVGQGSVFDYFAVEVFQMLDEHVKDFLVKAALLPSITPEAAYALTGLAESSFALSYLNKNHYFTDLYRNEYRFHPLFREFLLDQLHRRYGADEIKSLTIKAGQLLAQSGQTEEAIRVLLEVDAYVDALGLMIERAPILLNQGRSATLEEWAMKLPVEIGDESPWLSYWLGMGQLVTNPTGARIRLEKAFGLFEGHHDMTGCFLSVAAITNAIVLEWDDCEPLDRWITWIENHVDLHTPLAPPEIEAFVASAMVCGLTWRRPWDNNMDLWIDRTLTASEQVRDPIARLTAKGNVVEACTMFGNFKELHQTAEEFRQIAFSPDASPLVHLAYMVRAVELHDWINSTWEETISLIQKAISMAEDMGAYIHLGIMYIDGIVAAFEANNLKLAEEFIKKMDQAGFGRNTSIFVRYLYIRASYFLQTGDLVTARRDAEDSVNGIVGKGLYIWEAYAKITFAYILRVLGEREAAWRLLGEITVVFASLETIHIMYLVRLTEASLCFDEGDHTAGRKALSEAFRIGRIKGYAFTLYAWWQPEQLAFLCSEALSAGIETEYVKELIKCHRLVPHCSVEGVQEWPWPVRIRTFGRFEIMVNGEPLTFTGKVQKRPLALLKALICLGGREVRQEAVEDMLWPEAEGDAARGAFKTNLSRLRKLLGSDHAIEVRDGKVSLNTGYVCLDVWALRSMAERLSDLWQTRQYLAAKDDVRKLPKLLLAVYQGEFLPSDDDGPWMDACRNGFRRRFLGATVKLSDILNDIGDHEEALVLHEKCNQMDDTTSLTTGHPPHKGRGGSRRRP